MINMNKKIFTRIFVCLFSFPLIILCSCMNTDSSMTTSVTTDPGKNRFVPTTQITSMNTLSSDQKYLSWVNSLKGDYGHSILESRLSPNEKWLLSYAQFYGFSDYVINLLSVNNETADNAIDIQDQVIDLKQQGNQSLIMLYPGHWSPDSTAFIVEGPEFLGNPYTFMIIVDISNPSAPTKTVVKWKYEGVPYISWSPDSSLLLVWFGPEIPLGKHFSVNYTDIAWVLDRKGNLVNELNVADMRSPTWLHDQLIVLKNETEIWKIDPLTGDSELLMESSKPIEKFLSNNIEQTKIIGIEKEDPYRFVIINTSEKTIEKTIENKFSLMEGQVAGIKGYQTSSHYSIIYFSAYHIFDWQSEEIVKEIEHAGSVIWSPLLQGFLVDDLKEDRVKLFYP